MKRIFCHAEKLKRLTLIALVLALILLLTGCGEEMIAGMTEQIEAADEALSAEPEATQAPMTAEMFTDREAVYRYYNEVQIGDTLEGLTERYGEPTVETTENGETYTWVMDDGYGVVCVFFESGKLRAKGVYYDDLRQFGLLSNSTSIGNLTALNSSVTFEMARGLMGGRGMEILQIAQDTSSDPEVKRVFVWSNEKGDVVQILFSGDEKLESVSYTLAED